MKITTRGGDKGGTSLGDGTRVPKDDVRVSLVGTLDECQAHVGAARAISDGRLHDELLFIEKALGLLMGHLTKYEGCACPPISHLEDVIAEAEAKGEGFAFLAPGDSQRGAALHIARTVARRAERVAAPLLRTGEIGEDAAKYLNRLSDFFYALAVLL